MVLIMVVMNMLFYFNVLLEVVFLKKFFVLFFFGNGVVFSFICFEINYIYFKVGVFMVYVNVENKVSFLILMCKVIV